MSNNKIDKALGYVLDRYEYVKARLARTAPKYISSEVSAVDYDRESITFTGTNEEEIQQKISVFVSWVYSNIISLGNQCSAQALYVKTKQEHKYSKDAEHPLAKIFHVPNEFMPMSYLLRHLIWGLSISKYGGFWYLAPDKNTGELSEIWPIDPNRIQPIKNPDHYVKKFLYTAKNPLSDKTKVFTIDSQYVFWIKYPNVWDYWKNLPPLLAAFFPAQLERTIEDNQQRIYGDSRGIPLSVVSVDSNLSEQDFEAAKEQIIHDWTNGEASIAIARAGQINVQSLGFTYEQLETIGQQEITRDKIDAIFFGYAYRSSAMSTGEGLKQIDRIIKEQVIYPLLTMIQQSINAQIVQRYYPDEDIVVEFDDPRTADRALNIQKSMIESRWKSMNDMRELDGEPPMKPLLGIDIGEMPVSLANNSAFIMSLAGLNGARPQYQEGEPEVGNLRDSLDPEAAVNEIVDSQSPVPNLVPDGVSQKSVLLTGMLTELGRWKTVSRRNLERGENRDFITEIIPIPIQETLKTLIADAQDKDELFKAFDVAEQSINQWVDDNTHAP